MASISPTLRRAIRERRVDGEQQYKIAIRADVHPSLLSHILNGSIRLQPGDLRVLKIAAAVGVPPDEAFAEDEHEVEDVLR